MNSFVLVNLFPYVGFMVASFGGVTYDRAGEQRDVLTCKGVIDFASYEHTTKRAPFSLLYFPIGPG